MKKMTSDPFIECDILVTKWFKIYKVSKIKLFK